MGWALSPQTDRAPCEHVADGGVPGRKHRSRSPEEAAAVMAVRSPG